MALKGNWQNLVDGESEIIVKTINDMAEAIIELEEIVGEVDEALDELHNYAQALIGGGA
jgi:hypothetical protein